MAKRENSRENGKILGENREFREEKISTSLNCPFSRSFLRFRGVFFVFTLLPGLHFLRYRFMVSAQTVFGQKTHLPSMEIPNLLSKSVFPHFFALRIPYDQKQNMITLQEMADFNS